jgi:hypothetical protein
MRTLPAIGILFLSFLAQSASTAQSESSTAAPLPASAPERNVVISLKDHRFVIGEVPLFMDSYSAAGTRGGGLSGDLRDAVLDLSKLEKGQWVPLGRQDDGKVLALVCAETPKIVVTADGLVYPFGATTMNARGPFIRIRLYDDDGNRVDPASLTITVASGPTVYAHSVADGFLIVSGVSGKPLALSLSSGEQKRNYAVFPYVRGVSPELVAYQVHKVNMGKRLPESE